MTDSQALACSLSGPELVERITEWAQVASQATRRHVEKGRIVSTYPQDDALLQELRRLIAAEANCCAFMRFTLAERPNEVEIELRVPEDMTDAVATVLGLATR